MLLELENHLNSKYQDVTNYVIKKSQTSNNFIKEINKLTYEIRKIGININQIAKVSNQTGNVNYIYLEHYKKELDKLILEIRDKVLDIGRIRR